MPSTLLSKLPFGLVPYIASEAYAQLPYNPTSIFEVSAGKDKQYYILQPPSSQYSSGQFVAINKAATLNANTLPTQTLSSSLPFLNDNSPLPYTAVLQSNGSIAVYVGSCSSSPTKARIWHWSPSSAGDNAGIWSSSDLTDGRSTATGSFFGPQFLASGISFSYNTNQPDSLYTFGGMCPRANATTETWTSDSTYSGQLYTISANGAVSASDTDNGQPTPEAGFTMTPLLPTYSNTSSGSQTQQQDFILIGGQTQQAFIDMDTIAMFSLPQSSWTFLQVTSSASTDLAVKRQTPNVDPRSGHTAVMTTDGSKIVVFGGWVGDVMNPAEPQLVMLEVGAGYGGSGDWTWITSDPSPFSSGAGIYGHGAIMLPGDVMMVTGGYSIAASSNSRKRKRADQLTNEQNYFLNTTSGQWLDSYVPLSVAAGMTMHSSGGILETSSQKAGLGAGLAVGLIALICVIIFSTLYYRKLKRQRAQHEENLWEHREKEIDDLANVAYGQDLTLAGGSTGGAVTGAAGSQRSMSQRSSDAYPWVYDNSSNGIRSAERSGLYVDVPSPQRGLRRSMSGRGYQYLAAPRNDDRGLGFSSGDMHAIQERDEELSNPSSSRKASSTQRPDLILDTDAANLDPFKDPAPPLSSEVVNKTIRRKPAPINTPSSVGQHSMEEDRHREMSGWMRDWEAGGSGSRNKAAEKYSPTKSGRSSPSKSDRTRSDLSERSTLSHTSGAGLIPSRGPSSRSVIRGYLPSILPTAFTNSFTSPIISPTHTENMYGSSSSGPSHGSDRTNSFTTAQTTISQLQAESESLLISPKRHRHNRSNSSNYALRTPAQYPRGTGTVDLVPDIEPTFTMPRTRVASNQGSPTRARQSSLVGTWVGSVKRGMGKALTGNRTVSLTSDVGPYPRAGGIGSDGYYDYSKPGAPESPKKSDLGGLIDLALTEDETATAKKEKIRRSVSESGAFWQTKRGAKDWDVEPIPALVNERNQALVPQPLRSSLTDANMNKNFPPLPRSAGMESAWSRAESLATGTSEDWDVEAAVEQRVVQVMFTVPREKLRVVNADVDAVSLASREERAEIVDGDADKSG